MAAPPVNYLAHMGSFLATNRPARRKNNFFKVSKDYKKKNPMAGKLECGRGVLFEELILRFP